MNQDKTLPKRMTPKKLSLGQITFILFEVSDGEFPTRDWRAVPHDCNVLALEE